MSGIDHDKIAKDYVGLELILKQMDEEIKLLINNNQKTRDRLLFLDSGLSRVLTKLKEDIFERDQ